MFRLYLLTPILSDPAWSWPMYYGWNIAKGSSTMMWLLLATTLKFIVTYLINQITTHQSDHNHNHTVFVKTCLIDVISRFWDSLWTPLGVNRAWTSMTPDCPCMTAYCLVSCRLPCASKGCPIAMAVTELWTGSVISRGGSLLYIFIAANASPTAGF